MESQPQIPPATGPDGTPNLKHLEFVLSIAERAATAQSFASDLYSKGRAYTPSSMEDTVKKVEEKVAEYGAPVMTSVQDQGMKTLEATDQQVDKFVGKLKDLGLSTERLKDARDNFVKQVDESYTFVKEKGVTGISEKVMETMQAAIKEAKDLPSKIVMEQSRVVMDKLVDSYDQFIKTPAVAKVIDQSKPSVEYAKTKYRDAQEGVVNKYMEVHAAVTTDARYASVLDYGAAMAGYVQKTTIYQKVAPYVEPATAKLMENSYVIALLEHFKPKATTTAAEAGAAAQQPIPQADPVM